MCFTDGCSTNNDCQLSGFCKAGICICDDGWKGETCGLLDLRPAKTHGAYGIVPNVSSWGGNVIFADGQYHGYFAEMANGCGLCHWGSNSRVIHAVSNSLEGPYSRKNITVPIFSHNPQVVAVPYSSNTTYILFHINHHTPIDVPKCTAEDPTGANTTAPDGGQSHGNIQISTSPYGPWTPLSGSCNNPAPFYHPNGTWYQLCRAGGGGMQYNATLISASSFYGPWTTVASIAGPNWGPDRKNCEDPFLWLNSKGTWKALFHCFRGPTNTISAYAWSTDGLSWNVSAVQPYNLTVNYVDGSTANLTTRERPKLFLDPDNLRPLALFNAARLEHGTGDGGKGKCGTDWTFTLVQRIGSH